MPVTPTFRTLPLAILVTTSLWLGGCAVGPTYEAPAPTVTLTWQAPVPHGGQQADLSQWWAQFDDPTLVQLITWAEADSPTLTQAWARIEQARATLVTAQAGGRPQLGSSASASRSQQASGTQSSIVSTRSLGLDVSWEIDLFGRIQRSAEAASARIEARQADWHDARISLAAEVADTYVQYRTCGLLVKAYTDELNSITATQKATASMVNAGLSAPSDDALAQASLAGTRSSWLNQKAQCDLLVKSLVDLTGQPEPELRTALDQGQAHIPDPHHGLAVDSVPAQVLRQRPDLAALERELAAASADIGAAEADLYPSLSLAGSISRSFTRGGSALTSWSFGPQLSLPILDGGQRRAQIDTAQASYTSALASYRQGVRSAVKEVEQALVYLDSAVQRSQAARRAHEQYQRYLSASAANWRAGTISLLNLEEARRAALSAELEDISLQQNQVLYWIALYKALGGGWTADTPATSPDDLAASSINTSTDTHTPNTQNP